MKTVAILSLCSLGCAQPAKDPLEASRTTALACVERQVPEGTAVPEARSQSIVANCQSEFEDWTRALVEQAYQKPFDKNDSRMANAYNRELRDKIRLMELRISEGPHQDLPTI